MKNKIDKTSNLATLIVTGVAFITLFFNPRIQDPFNSPKMWILLILTAWLIGPVIDNRNIFIQSKLQRYSFIVIFTFIGLLFISTLMTDVKITAFFGENQRRTGFLTYLSFAIIFLCATLYINLENIVRVNLVGAATGLLLATYGALQISGHDFISWNNPYNAIISTVGNPNFAAAVMAILGVLSFGLVFTNNLNPFIRASSFLTSIFLLVVIYLSDALQGLLSFAIGVSVILVVVIWQHSKKLGIISVLVGIVVGFIGVMGMLQVGPLSEYLYKSSVTVRGYYWRAGIEMFKHHLLFGVGVDRYGAYFKEFRDKQYPLNYGFSTTSTNAHNVPIQIFATAGVFAGIAYLLLVTFVFYCGIKGIQKFKGNNQVLFTSIFAAWLAYQAQSIISIDNIGIAVWGWLLAGVVVGVYALSNIEAGVIKSINKSSKFAGSFTSWFLIMISLVLVITLYQGEYNMFQQRKRFNPQIAENRKTFHQYAVKTLDTPLVDPYYKMTTGAYLVSNMYIDEGMKVLLDEYKLDPRNLDNLGLLADFSFKMNQINESIKYRKEIYVLDPWNAKNLLDLGRMYKATGKLTEMSDVLQKILSFAPNTPEATSAKIDLI